MRQCMLHVTYCNSNAANLFVGVYIIAFDTTFKLVKVFLFYLIFFCLSLNWFSVCAPATFMGVNDHFYVQFSLFHFVDFFPSLLTNIFQMISLYVHTYMCMPMRFFFTPEAGNERNETISWVEPWNYIHLYACVCMYVCMYLENIVCISITFFTILVYGDYNCIF